MQLAFSNEFDSDGKQSILALIESLLKLCRKQTGEVFETTGRLDIDANSFPSQGIERFKLGSDLRVVRYADHITTLGSSLLGMAALDVPRKDHPRFLAKDFAFVNVSQGPVIVASGPEPIDGARCIVLMPFASRATGVQ